MYYLAGLTRQFSTIHATILSTTDQQLFVRRLSRRLKESGKVVIDNMMTVMEKCNNNNPVNQSNVLLEYIKSDSIDGIIVISSSTLTRSMNNGSNIDVLIDGDAVKMDLAVFKKGVDEQFCRKVILLMFSGVEASVPDCFVDVDSLVLAEQTAEGEVSRLTTDRVQAALKKKTQHK